MSAMNIGIGLAILALAVALAWRVLNWLWLRPKKLERLLREQGFKGNPYKFLNGDLKESAKMIKESKSRPIGLSDDPVPRIHPFVLQSVNTYGKDFFKWMGPTPRLNIMNPDHIKGIFSKIYDFEKSTPNPLVVLIANGLTNHEGEKWATHRKIINPAFHLEKLKLMLPACYLSCDEMVKRWEKLISTEESVELNAWPDLQNLTCDVISRTAFGSSYEEGKRIFELQIEQVELAIQYMQTIYIPGWRFVPTKMNRRMKHLTEEVHSLLRRIISRRDKSIRAEEAATADLLGLLLESNMKEQHENRGNKYTGMSIQDVIEECKLFYFAGQETTSILLVWAMILLSIHPQWQDRAREEVLQVFGRDGKPDLDGLNRLKIVTMILYEVMRLYPPVTMINRFNRKEMKLGKLTIPAGVELSVPILLVHHDKEHWGEDAKEFKPERFSEGISKATRNQVVYLPFGWGPRICIGMNFALIEAKMAMAMILQRFSFGLSPSYAHAPTAFLTLHPQHGAQIILRRAE
ncbi:hypothetical protein CDL15_Pgr001241 [Punica granatum]|uniref:Cytochrome P450 CYP72A219-like n=1 Tax=Punica granatum TaxID=22663 RepID=A0A218WJW9_PUNGR|nr:hypothetical protein CDL15_Pgr001241 [Punica granatum]